MQYLGRFGEASTGDHDFIFAVSDGMGGAQAGEFASRIAVDKITRLMPKSFKQSASGIAVGFEDIFTELYVQIHKALSYLGDSDPDCNGMGATLSLCWFTPGWMYHAHIGDSRIYYLPKGGGIKQLSEDDTYVGWLFRQGKINERQAHDHPARTSLQKALGAGHRFVDPQVGAVGYNAGDQFLLCTDGLTDGLYDANLLQMLREPDAAEREQMPSRRLLQASLQRSGRDNTTALVIDVL